MKSLCGHLSPLSRPACAGCRAGSDASTFRATTRRGCLHDLQSAVTTTYSTPPGSTPHDTGQTMAFFPMQRGDAPLFKTLADRYSSSDNYHQPVFGGTGPDSQPLGFADQVFYSDGNGNPATPPSANVYDPDTAAGNAEPLHASCAMVRLLGRDAARHRRDRGLSGRAAVSRPQQLRTRPVFSGRERRSRIHATGVRSAADSPFRRRRSGASAMC